MPSACFHLTVAEGKRLIARAVARIPAVREALRDGLIAIGKGSTNAYVAEELLGRPIEKAGYLLGNTQPSVGAQPLSATPIAEIVLRNGEPVEGLSVIDAALTMKPGDVVLKGANALSPDRRMAGVLIGNPTGGTAGNTLGHVIGKGVTQIIPVGLEKTIPGDLWDVASRVNDAREVIGSLPRFWISQGTIVTEIEALAILAGVEARAIGAGGINGAEGSVWFLVDGERERVDAALREVESVLGEPAFADS